MRFTKRVRPFVVVPVALLLCAACAAGAGRGRGAQSPEVIFQVHNDLNPPRALTVRLISQTGTRALLGSLTPGQTRSFRYRDAAYHGQYRLVAEGAAGGDVASTSFVLTPGTRVVWTVQTNSIRIPDR